MAALCMIALLTGCGSDDAAKVKQDNSVQQKETQKEAQKEPTQDELNEQLKKEAVPANFTEIDSYRIAKDTKLTAKGEVTSIEKDGALGVFTLTTTEGDGYGMYSITNFSSAEVSEGDNVEIWGVYSDKNNVGMPSITATIIEKAERKKGFQEENPVKKPEKQVTETLSQKNAVAMANDYLDYTAFSKSGLIEQLEYEGFSNEDATYAVNKISVDWKEQAVNMANDYLDYTSFSRSGLIEQLEYEGFSNEDAVYAVDQIGL
ncbi:protein of unknown function (DUF1535) [Desulfitobacterium dehalogenans ATCC 51507]|uniref:Putative host cell surface-exposed lipoprotein Ltp-like HTH region domain-containing protein n=2 Tax=Desulfitobacterium dehalogenans TaxID=36854 RepID=I4A9Y1_DESDJ|nr:protein of unknown function (DUF1535) [Desulfitobacterium dehalogenans ATCC 51507]